MPDKTLPTRETAIAVRPESIPVPEGKTERRELRTVNSKTFLHPEKAADGKEIRTCQATIGAVCYHDDGGSLRSIDTTVRDLGEGLIGVEWAPYRFTLHATGIGFNFESREGGRVAITLTGIGGEKFDQDTPLKPDIDGNTITFRDVRPGCDIVFKCLNQRVKTLRILHDENAPRTFDWAVVSDKPELIDSTLFGTDAAGNQLELFATVDGDTITETWDGETQDKTPVVYPVEIDPTVNETIADNVDNGWAFNSASWSYWTSAGTNDPWGDFSGNTYDSGVRFTSVAIDQGVTVTSATLTRNCTTASGTTGTIYGIDVDDAPQFDNSNLPTGLAHTTASTAVAALGSTGDKAYDVTSICQEVFDRAGWANNNDLAFAFIHSNATLSRWGHLAGGQPATLSITYTAAAGGTAGNLLLLDCG